ncbi:NUDIX domain-containing protein [Streptomyces sp. NPDC049879]|uniref:NUDIX domain-containing protein n=1 Tax=Streptomyces sp. NPDC049879 TaxID=3365598 RepID=UPI0037A3E6B2
MTTLPPEEFALRADHALALLRTYDGHLVLGIPAYRPDMVMIGGGVLASETHSAALTREVREEVGLWRPAGRLLVLEQVPATISKPAGTTMVFDVAPLGPDSPCTVHDDELRGLHLLHPDALAADHRPPGVGPRLARRLRAALRALEGGGTVEIRLKGAGQAPLSRRRAAEYQQDAADVRDGWQPDAR